MTQRGERVFHRVAAAELRHWNVGVEAGTVTLPGTLAVPAGARGLVLFIPVDGEQHLGPLDSYVAGSLEERGIATLLIDFLLHDEGEGRPLLDLEQLTERVQLVTDWLRVQPETGDLAVAYFGIGAGAASALRVAARDSTRVAAVISIGGRLDMAINSLPQVRVPTLLIVSEDDELLIGMNEAAHNLLQCKKQFVLVHGQKRAAEKPGTAEEIARLTLNWLQGNLPEATKRAA